MHLLLFSLLLGLAAGSGLDDRKGPLENKVLMVPEATPVPYAIYQFQAATPGVTGFSVSGDAGGKILVSADGWLYAAQPLEWAHKQTHTLQVAALVDDQAVEGPVTVTIVVVDINNHAPSFNQTDYAAVVKERSPAGVPFARVFASDLDDPESPNARLSYSLVTQIPNKLNTLYFQVNGVTGEISTTADGERLLKAREGVLFSRVEESSRGDALKRKFDEFCSPTQAVPYHLNPFFTCVEKAELRRLNPLEDPDFTLIVRVEDLGGASENALSGSARVSIAVQQNLWVSPGVVTVTEQLTAAYPMVIAKVQSNDPSALYRLGQKERDLPFPFSVTSEGEIQLTEQLDREEKDMYILVVFAEDLGGRSLDPPMEIQVMVEDVNDNAPVCEQEESVFEVQESEQPGSVIGQLLVHDADEENTANSLLSYALVSTAPFTVDDSGRMQTTKTLRRVDAPEYHLTVRVTDPGFSTECKVLVKVIDINNELPIFEKSNYGVYKLSEDTPVGHTVLTVRATDADDPGSGSSRIQFTIAAGNDDGAFAMETGDINGEGRLVLVKPLDFETTPSTQLQIDARNPEPLVAGMAYDAQSSASVSVDVGDVDEAPQFDEHVLDVTVPEDTVLGTTLMTVGAKDPEGKDIGFKLTGVSNDWLEIDPATGEIKTRAKLDRETQETFEATVVVFEKANPAQYAERALSVRLLDVNDNVPRLREKQAFICVGKPAPVILTASDPDHAPFAAPFSFLLGQGKKSPNWDLQAIDGTSAKLSLKKPPSEDKTFLLPINIKDSAGMGVTQSFEVRVCNCTVLGYCYSAPGEHSGKMGMSGTVGILAGTTGFILLAFIIVVHQIKKSEKKRALEGHEDTNAML